jgi:phosphatidylethanolamine/phosphatidyl-N-methylethanolamine N-methyltransferase
MFQTDHWRFFMSWLRDPRKVASVAPSSKRLGRALASRLDLDIAGPVIELGGGTGSITRALLEAGVPAERLVTIESDGRFAEILARKFPGITVIHGDAQAISSELKAHGVAMPVSSIVSSLPMLTLPQAVQGRILQECAVISGDATKYVQYTYGFGEPLSAELVAEHGLAGRREQVVWSNLPPAAVWIYRRMQAAVQGVQ